MKQAILIVAYRDLDFLKTVINSFDPHNFLFFIHLNKKSFIPIEDIKILEAVTNVVLVEQKYVTYWGSMNHLRAILFLCEKAIEFDVDYLHLISGQDFPIKSSTHITDFLSKNHENEYLEHFELPSHLWEDEGLGYDRINYYHLNDFINSSSQYGRGLLKVMLKVQKFLRIRRSLDKMFPKLYGGGTWWTLSKPCVSYVINYTHKNPAFFNRFKHTKIAEELYFQTILMNSTFKDKIVNNNLRLILWELKNGSRPAILDETDYKLVEKSEHLFARKFVQPTSSALIKIIKENLI